MRVKYQPYPVNPGSENISSWQLYLVHFFTRGISSVPGSSRRADKRRKRQQREWQTGLAWWSTPGQSTRLPHEFDPQERLRFVFSVHSSFVAPLLLKFYYAVRRQWVFSGFLPAGILVSVFREAEGPSEPFCSDFSFCKAVLSVLLSSLTIIIRVIEIANYASVRYDYV